MTSRTHELDRYKLETTFYAGEVVHTTYASYFPAGEVKTRWKRKEDIGKGGFGIVWLEEEEEGKQLRAVKKLPRELQKSDWLRELDTLAKLKDHQALFVQFHGWYENSDFIFLAMEYIEHGDLSHYLKRLGFEARPQAKEIIRQLLKGLVVLHEQNICHRDLKPQNVLVASLSPIWVKIADFGSSKREKGTELRTNCGTPGYLAPELLGLLPKDLKGNVYTNSVDIWCLGVLTHEILTLEIPFLDTALYTVQSSPEKRIKTPAPQLDFTHMYEYCRGYKNFPAHKLQNFRISEKGINFVESLLVVDPRSRSTAKDALTSPWLLDETPEINLVSQIEVRIDLSCTVSVVHGQTAEADPPPAKSDSILAAQQPVILMAAPEIRLENQPLDLSDMTTMGTKPVGYTAVNMPLGLLAPVQRPRYKPDRRVELSPILQPKQRSGISKKRRKAMSWSLIRDDSRLDLNELPTRGTTSTTIDPPLASKIPPGLVEREETPDPALDLNDVAATITIDLRGLACDDDKDLPSADNIPLEESGRSEALEESPNLPS